jgi:hypothetical protein
VDDVAFIVAVVSAIEREVPIDRHRVFATGISNGGIMDYALACRTRIFAAIGPDSATELGSCPDPSRVAELAGRTSAAHRSSVASAERDPGYLALLRGSSGRRLARRGYLLGMRQIARRVGQVGGGLALVLGLFWAGRVSAHGLSAYWEHWWCPIPLALILLGLVAVSTTNWRRGQATDAPTA